jgi:hypothetical protein
MEPYTTGASLIMVVALQEYCGPVLCRTPPSAPVTAAGSTGSQRGSVVELSYGL